MFQFKQFTIHQDRTAMKVGTDGVLLGAWASITPNASRLLDIGTGTGLIALMLAQRFSKQSQDPKYCPPVLGERAQRAEGVINTLNSHLNIDAIDIDQSSIEQATENIKNSPFAQYITTYHTSLQNHNPEEKYDAIVCNPPYFVASLKCPDASRTQARHTDSLSFDDLLLHSSRLLNDNGTLSVILPVIEGNQLIELAPKYGFSLTHLTEVHPTPTAPTKRLLLQFVMRNSQLNQSSLLISHSSLTIEISRHQYTPEYIALTRDFYLKM
jgi:tRNA1Val (adenine37-N6)-methyltransferase